MKKTMLIFIVTALVSHSLNAQLWRLRRLEITAAAGTTHSFTDIGRYITESNYLGFRDISKVNMGFAAGANVRYRLTNDLAVRADFIRGFLHASDIHGTEVARGYEAMTEIMEPSISAEFYIIKNKRENALLFIKARRTARYPFMAYFDMYVFAGIGGVVWDVSPNPSLALHITDTKGFTPVVPAGIGIARNFTGKLKGGIELGGRYLLGDDLEALSLQGTGNDSYYFLNLHLTWRLKTQRYPGY